MAVTRVYEPGSVNKVVTIAGALEDGRIDTTQRLHVPDSMRVADVTFRDAEPHAPGWWSLPEIVAESSNVGTITVAQRLGRERIDHYLRAFGLGDSTGLGFPGESAGLLPDLSSWTGTSIATLPIGQGVAVTALQMLGVYNAIANGGEWVAPKLVRGITDESGRERALPGSPRRRVVSAETARTVATMLAGAVREGTGTAAAVPGYEVAGKTGTARKPRQGALGYKEGAYVASFVGFVPASAPQLSAIVVLDEPTPYYGGLVAAPLFKSVVGYGVRHFRVAPAPARPDAGAPGPGELAGTLALPPAAKD
jgi:cell division protein FtsI (penicillin-binding protein 3)